MPALHHILSLSLSLGVSCIHSTLYFVQLMSNIPTSVSLATWSLTSGTVEGECR